MANTSTTHAGKRVQYARRILVAGALLVGAVGAATYIRHQLAGAAEGSVVIKHSDLSKAQPPSSYRLDGDYLSFSYPGAFTVSSDQPVGAGLLQQNRLVSTTGGSQSLVVTVSKLPSGQLDDDPSYHMRELYPATYRLSPQVLHGEHVVIAARLDTFEKVAFWVHAGKLATIALSGTTTNRSAAETSFNQLLRTVAWQ